MGFYKYKTIESLKDELISYRSECSSWFNNRKDINSIIVDSVGGNTFRAFRIKNGNRPSIIFRKWATESLGDVKKIKLLISRMNKENYNDANYYICINLKNYWDCYLDPLSIYKARKLVNLLFKEIALENSLTNEERCKLINLLHLPIDKSTLNGIMTIFNNYEYKHNIGKIPSSAGMGFIDSDLKYNTIQNFFMEIADEINVPSIYFDILFWNKNSGS